MQSETANDVTDGKTRLSTSHIYRLQKSGIRRVRGMLSRFMQHIGDNKEKTVAI